MILLLTPTFKVCSIGYYDTSVEWPYFSVVTNFTTPQRHAEITLNNNIEIIYYLGLGKTTSIWLSHSTSTGVITSSRKILCECAKANLCINGTPWTKKHMSVFLYLVWAPKIKPFPTMYIYIYTCNIYHYHGALLVHYFETSPKKGHGTVHCRHVLTFGGFKILVATSLWRAKSMNKALR